MLAKMRNVRAVQPLLRWLHRLMPDRYVTLMVLGGSLRGRHLRLNLRYQMGYWFGLTEPDVAAAMQAIVAPGEVVYDVGAEIGYFSVMAAVMAHTGRVYMFEPNPANIEILKDTVCLNKDLNLIVVPTAVGNMRGRVEFVTYEGEADVKNASLLGRLAEIVNGEAAGDSISVDMIDLDSFSVETHSAPGVVKIDVEGAEALVLQGMARLLSTIRPRLIIEIHNDAVEREVLMCLNAQRYQVRPIGRTFARPYPFRVLAMPLQNTADA